MGTIHYLPQAIIHQIAAGEVIERPVSVVKELVENAIDAKATNIHVSIKNGGKDVIKVEDNGEGMTKEDLEICIEKHTTSKISSLEDMYSLITMGFRGEALYAISHVSYLTIISKHRQAPIGYTLEYDPINGKKIYPTEKQDGTTVIVKSLFFNTPARSAYLKSAQKEFLKIHEFLESIAFAYPNIAFFLTHNEKEALYIPKHESLEQRILSISKQKSNALIYIEETGNHLTLRGWIRAPHACTEYKEKQLTFVNNRLVFSYLIYRAVNSGYNSFIPQNYFPFYILYIEIDPYFVDVNVHPRKTEVKFQDENEVFSFISSAIKKHLQAFSLQTLTSIHIPPGKRNHETNNSGSNGTTQTQPFPFSEYSLFSKKIPESNYEERAITPLGKIIGQAHNSYILVETQDAIVIYDQHALAERILFEKLTQKKETILCKKLLFPLDISLSLQEWNTFLLYESCFQEIHFEFRYKGNHTISIVGFPNFLKKEAIERTIREMLQEMQEYETLAKESIERAKKEFYARIACKSAIKFGDTLSMYEMSQLLHDAQKCYSVTCPHGRPVAYTIPIDELNNYYKR